MLISDAYRVLNAQLHEKPDYGMTGGHLARHVIAISDMLETRDILDYGCGKCALQDALGFTVSNYDPSIPRWAPRPAPADIVVCTEVLEHIEPECLPDVLDDLRRVTRRMLIASVSTHPASTILPDGRNAHLIQQSADWWLPQFETRFSIVMSGKTPRGPKGFLVMAIP